MAYTYLNNLGNNSIQSFSNDLEAVHVVLSHDISSHVCEYGHYMV